MNTQQPPPAVPSNERMLRGIKQTLQSIARRAPDAFSTSALAAIDVVLNELLCRQSSAFYVSYYARARECALEGLKLLTPGDPEQSRLAALIDLAPAELSPALGFSHLHSAISELMLGLAEIAALHQERSLAGGAKYLARVTAMEHELLARGQEFAAADKARSASPNPAAAPPVLTRESFAAYAARRFPERRGLRVADFRELTGGYQKTTILVDLEDDSGRPESIVIRAEKDDRFVSLDAGDIVSEFEIVKLAYAGGVPVAEPLWIESDPAALGQRFFVSKKVDGYNLGTAVAADAVPPRDLVQDFVATLAKIHQVPIDAALKKSPIGRWLRYTDMRDNTLANVDYWMGQPWTATGNPSPILRRLRVWLDKNVPVNTDSPCLIHGDYGVHNVLVKGERVSGVLDWEAARVGDPAEDLSWFLQSSAGKIDSAEVLEWYRERTGRRVSEYSLRYYDVFNTMKILVGASCAAAMHEATPAAAIEWCNIPFIWAPLLASGLQAKIDAADAVREK